MVFLKKSISYAVRPLEVIEKSLFEAQQGVFSNATKKYTSAELEEISSEFLFTKIVTDLKKHGLTLEPGTELPTYFKEIENHFGKNVTNGGNVIINLIRSEFIKKSIPYQVKKGITSKRHALIIY